MDQEPAGSVLLIEDHHDIAEMVYAYLEHRGYQVDHAADGITGLHLAVTNDYDVLVLDLMLPGLDGVELCEKLRTDARRDIPVLVWFAGKPGLSYASLPRFFWRSSPKSDFINL